MNILYIAQTDPRRSDFGSAQRTHLLWKALQRLGDVYSVYTIGPYARRAEDETDRIKAVVFAPEGWLLTRIFGCITTWFYPLVWPFRVRSLKRRLPWQTVKFDKIVVRYQSNVALAQAWKLGPTYVDIDDLPIDAYRLMRAQKQSALFDRLGAAVVVAWQNWILGKCKGSWIADSNQVCKATPFCPCVHLPNLALAPCEKYQIEGLQKQQIMTVGLMSYLPNYSGVDWFVDKVWPRIFRGHPNARYLICGGGVSEFHKTKWSAIPGVEVLGFVQDIDRVYEESLAVVVPIMSGAGTCIKVIEAALHGRKVFATSHALRGYGEDDRVALGQTCCDDPEDLACAIGSFLSLNEAERCSQQAKICAEACRFNSFEGFARKVEEIVKM